MKKILLLFFIVCAVTGCKKKQVDLGAGFNTVNLQLHYYKQENQEGLKNVIDAFERANPDIKIELHCDPNGDDSLMSSRADVGTLPDILQMQSYSRIKEYASRGLIVDITREAIMTKVLPSALPAVSWNGKQYALPMDFAGIGIIYNKDIFSKLHIVPPETFEELKEVCKVLQDNGIDPFAALLKENWSMGHFITMIHTALMKERNIDPERFITDMNASKTSYGIIDTDRLFEVLDFYRENLSPNGANMGGAEQQQAFATVAKQEEASARQVVNKDDLNREDYKFDARDGSKNQYQNNQKKKKVKQKEKMEDGHVRIKGMSGGFDMTV